MSLHHRWLAIGLAGFTGIAVLSAPNANAQLSYGGAPASQTLRLTTTPPTMTMPTVDVSALMDEDLLKPKNAPFRFGYEHTVHVDPASSGAWETVVGGMRVWRLRVTSKDAFSLNFVFSKYALTDGTELYLYADGYLDLKGSYNALDNAESGLLGIEAIAGEAVTLELNVPAWQPSHGELVLRTVVHAYRDILAIMATPLRNMVKAAGACEIDVKCPQSAGWEKEINAVVRYVAGGSLCTGSLINNTANNGTQYLITASHCGGLNSAVFYFNYEKPGCGTGAITTNHTVSGSTQKALNSANGFDVRLVQITQAIPSSYNPFYAGWDRTDVAPPSTVCIHHPQGDAKKFSRDNNPPTKSGTEWRILQWDLGVTEPGSSGSPLYTSNRRYIGQLYGGASFCGFPFDDFYPRFAQNWNTVKAFLDPLNTAPTTLDGFDPNLCGAVTPYGVGCSGTGGFTPLLNLTGCLHANGNVTLSITQALGGQNAFLFFGLTSGNTPLGGGCSLLVSPLLGITVGPLPLAGAGAGAGNISLPVVLPASTAPGTATMQAACTDPGKPGGATWTRGLTMVFE